MLLHLLLISNERIENKSENKIKTKPYRENTKLKQTKTSKEPRRINMCTRMHFLLTGLQVNWWISQIH